jgi:hypothetical protein
MPVRHPEDHELAGRAWAQLLVLRANPYPQAVPALTRMAREIGVKDGPVLDSERNLRNVQADAWLAVCALAQQIEKDPKAEGIEDLWIKANEAMKTWEREAE